MKIAAITMVYNENVFLPLWEKHYGGTLGHENTYIIDHGTDDGSTDHLQGNRLRIPRELFDNKQRANFISQFHGSLLQFYDAVIYTDCDEILIPDPDSYKDLRDYVENNGAPCSTALGINVLHRFDDEPDIDLSRPILSQRPMRDKFQPRPPLRGAFFARIPGTSRDSQ